MDISVIIPVYKVANTLCRCVDSIISQSFSDWELILVDDGSPDSCGAICDEYAEKDSRIKVIHKDNGGLSDARNAGLKIAEGEYVTFVDSDDQSATSVVRKTGYFGILLGNAFRGIYHDHTHICALDGGQGPYH